VTPTLRPYQQQLISDARDAMRHHRRICIVLPTGGGKSAIAGFIAATALERGRSVVVVAHRRRLIQQLSETMHRWGASGALVQSVQSIRPNRMPAPDLLLVDEAHHLVAGNQWGRLIDAWPDARLVGLTATPARLDGVGLGVGHGGYFEHLVLGPDAGWLTAQGFLAPARVYSWPLSMAGVRTRCGDYDQAQATQRMVAVMGDAVTEYQRLLNGQTAIANCCSVAHAEAVAEAFRAAGIPAAALTGHTSRQQQDQLFADLTRGTLRVLAQCEMVSEGVDIPAVAGALMLRPTQSLVVWLQQLGRALRPAPGKAQAIILDHAGNAHRPGLGLPTDPREWTLEGRKRRKADPAAAVRSCPVCFCCVPALTAVCPECGHIWQTVTRKVELISGELQELQRIERRRSVGRARSREELEAIRLERGYQRGWTDRILAARGGRR
jgi:superfamily II DNA or RNA helicase